MSKQKKSNTDRYKPLVRIDSSLKVQINQLSEEMSMTKTKTLETIVKLGIDSYVKSKECSQKN